MNVEQLIGELNKVKDKSVTVFAYVTELEPNMEIAAITSVDDTLGDRVDLNLENEDSSGFSIKVVEEEKHTVICAEEGDDFQEYCYADTGKKVPWGTPIGIEVDGDPKIRLLDNIKFLN